MASGSMLRHARHAKGMTQRELARSAGVAQSAIAKIETGVTVPRVDTLERLLAACGHTLDVRPSTPLVDPHDWTLVEQNLQLTPRERLEKLRNWAAFTARLRDAGERSRER